MSAEHNHSHTAGANARSLTLALILTATFLVVEVVGGVITRSLALISDAAHMLTDAVALAIALAAIRIGQRAADRRRTFGYHRFEILAAAFNALMLFGVAIYILYEAWQRIRTPPQIESFGMLVIAAVGLVVNLASMQLLAGGRDASLNVKGAYLEVWSDMLGSLGVIVGALVIRFTGWTWVDPLIAVLIGLWVLPRTWVLLKSSLNILLEGVPEDVDLEAVRECLASTPGVLGVHDLHVWGLTSGKTSLTVHLVRHVNADAESQVLPAVRERLAERFGIRHITVQVESVACTQSDEAQHFPDSTSTHAHPAGDRSHAH